MVQAQLLCKPNRLANEIPGHTHITGGVDRYGVKVADDDRVSTASLNVPVKVTIAYLPTLP